MQNFKQLVRIIKYVMQGGPYLLVCIDQKNNDAVWMNKGTAHDALLMMGTLSPYFHELDAMDNTLDHAKQILAGVGSDN